MSISNFLELELLDHLFTDTAYAPPATLYLALSTADPGEDGTGLAEPAGNGYARRSCTAADMAAAAAGAKSNGVELAFAQASGGTWGTITHIALMDAITAGNVLWSGALAAPRTVNDGDTFRFAIGNLTFTLD